MQVGQQFVIRQDEAQNIQRLLYKSTFAVHIMTPKKSETLFPHLPGEGC
jgi:hypothetical protein